MRVKDNLIEIKNSIPETVTLVAVSKTKPKELVMEAYNAGHRDFGENYVQELLEKKELLPEDIRWHFIGHLQSNKVKYIVPFVYMIHGVDSVKLLKEINKQSAKINKRVNCLLQVHIATEETKFGFDIQECEALLTSEEIKNLDHVNVVGFMGMASNTGDAEQIRNEFRSLKTLQNKMSGNNAQLSVISMGMSSDYQIAIEEGSTMIRIGSTVFGERNYGKDFNGIR